MPTEARANIGGADTIALCKPAPTNETIVTYPIIVFKPLAGGCYSMTTLFNQFNY